MCLYATCRALGQNGEKTNRIERIVIAERITLEHAGEYVWICCVLLDLAVTRGVEPSLGSQCFFRLVSVDMFFDRESTVVITKLGNLPETALISYCRKFGNVIRCLIKTNTQAKTKEPCKCIENLDQRIDEGEHVLSHSSSQTFHLDALVKFTEASSVTAILSSPSHIIHGTHVVMRTFHPEINQSGSVPPLNTLMSLSQQNPNSSAKPIHYEQILQENAALRHELVTLQQSLAEALTYSKTAYDTFQALREKFGKIVVRSIGPHLCCLYNAQKRNKR